jgi:hypothetical protein
MTGRLNPPLTLPRRGTGQIRPNVESPAGRGYMFRASTRIAAGAPDLSRRNVSIAQTRPQISKASVAHKHPCGLKSALRRSHSDHVNPILGGFRGGLSVFKSLASGYEH